MRRFGFVLLALLLFSLAVFAGVYLSPFTAGPIYEGRVERINIGTAWADVRAYSISIELGYATCTGNGSARTCGPCPVIAERATFKVTWWNGTESSLNNIREGETGEVKNQFRIKVKTISENTYVENMDSGGCNYIEPSVIFEFSPYVECAKDSDCPAGLGCADYKCVKTECNSNKDCAEDEFCANRQCYSVPRKSCGYIANHSWIDYECCADEDCRTGWKCANHSCRRYRLCALMSDCQMDEICSSETGHCEYIPPSSSCGTYSNHTWINFECCSNSDCPSDKICHEHKCTGCVTNNDCADNEICQSGSCVEITGCGRIANHTFTPYECCGDSDCFEEFSCVEHECKPISCPCGKIVNHECIPCTPTPTPVTTPTPTPAQNPEEMLTPAPTPTPKPAPSACPSFILLFACLPFLVKSIAKKSDSA